MDCDVDAADRRTLAAYAKRRDLTDPRYSWLAPSFVFGRQHAERRILARLAREGIHTLATQRILEVGCGYGDWLSYFAKWGATAGNLTGVDLIAERIEEARRRVPSGARLECVSAAKLPYGDEAFDIVLQATAFSSMLDAGLRRRVAAEMIRVLAPDGIILWYDFHASNPRNPDVRGVKRREIRALFADCDVSLEPATLAPPIARAVVPRAWLLADVLERVPFLCTHYIGIIRKGVSRRPLRAPERLVSPR